MLTRRSSPLEGFKSEPSELLDTPDDVLVVGGFRWRLAASQMQVSRGTFGPVPEGIMTYAERILGYLWSIAPEGASNRQIADRLSIRSQQTVCLLTQELPRKGLIRREQRGREWVFFGDDEPMFGPTPAAFASLAQRIFGARSGTTLSSGVVPGARQRFDFVSPDGRIDGDTYVAPPLGGGVPASVMFSPIAERVLPLEKTGAPTTFLVFGNDRQVPNLWLERYGSFLSNVTFYFLTDGGQVEELAPPKGADP